MHLLAHSSSELFWELGGGEWPALMLRTHEGPSLQRLEDDPEAVLENPTNHTIPREGTLSILALCLWSSLGNQVFVEMVIGDRKPRVPQ